MSGISTRQQLLASTIIAGAFALATPVSAQTTQEAPTAPAVSNPAPSTPAPVSSDGASTANTSEGGDEIIVTGSRIPHPDLESSSPVTIVGAQEVKQTGTTRIEDLLNQLPQVFADQGSTVTNGATGTAEVNLRGLGTDRTLVLVNGRRLVPGDPASTDSAADVNLIPGALIKRIDVLTGGASSVYGADAVAGVVNFVMDTEYDGFKLDGQYSLYNHDNRAGSAITDALNARDFDYPRGMSTNGGTIDVTAVFGTGTDDGRGHITGYAGYRKISVITEATRDYSSCTLAAKTTTAGYTCGGSPTAFNFLPLSPYAYYHVEGGALVPGQTIYNYAPTNFYSRPDERYTAGFFAHYDVSDAFKPYMEFMFMDDQTVAQIAPSGDFFNTSTLNCDNPLISAQEKSILCNPTNVTVGADGVTRADVYVGRRNVEGGGRRYDLEHTTYRGVIGAKGDLTKGLSYDAYYQYSRVDSSEEQENQFSVSRLTKALDVVSVNGVPTCRSVVDGTDPACVPYNIFTGTTTVQSSVTQGVTQEALDYIGIPTFSRGQNSEQVANISLTFLGSEYGLVSPLAHEGFALNGGIEYRKEALRQVYDDASRSGDIAGSGAISTNTAGSFDVKELFIEASLPLVQDKPFFEQLLAEAGYRRSHYEIGNSSAAFSTDTYKGALTWAPVRDIKIRATYNRAVRAPNIGELFAANKVFLDGSIDPCALLPGATFNGTTVNGNTFAQCALTGVTAAQFGHINGNPAQQYNGFGSGGNPFVKPETADSITAGVVLTPTFLKGFQATADFFDIKVKNLISALGADSIITQCIASGDPAYCNLIHRDANGSLFRTEDGYITDLLANNGSLRTRGVDITVGYTQELGDIGTLGISGVGTYLDKFVSHPSADVKFDCVGYYGTQCGTPNPKWRSRSRLTYTLPAGPSVSVQWRYFSKVKNDVLSSDTDLAGTSRPSNARIGAQSYFDLALTVPVADKLTLHAGMNNVLDRQPPINALGLSTENGNTFSQVYDALGRYLYFGATLDL